MRDYAVRQVGQPMLSRFNTNFESNCYLTNLCETRNAALEAVQAHLSSSSPIRKAEEKRERERERH